jgi:uncharacterized protein (DUF1501 family)
MSDTQRRAFLRQALTLTSMGVAAPMALNLSAITRAAAQSAGSGYRALVCIYLNGGNDAYNTVLATDATSWQHYRNQRDPSARNPQDTTPGIALMAPGVAASTSAAPGSAAQLGGVLPISHAGRAVHAGRQFALHPALKQVQAMHQAGRMAVVANVGPLTRPTTKADWADVSKSKPSKLFSHNDQQSTWLSFKPEGSALGWGGQIGDLVTRTALQGKSPTSDESLMIKSFTCMTPSNGSVWLSSQTLQAYQSSTTGILNLGSGNTIYGNAMLRAAVGSMMSATSTSNKFVDEHQRIVQRSLKATTLIGNKLPALGLAPWSTAGITNIYGDPKLQYTSPVDGSSKFNPLALQLQMVARLIEANRSGGMGLSRQLFMVNLGGFDTHDKQMIEHADRMAQLNHALDYFNTVLGHMPGGDMSSQVTTFTASEFGRSFTNNGDGTDHGWGGHQFVMGGAVRGTEVYGTFPTYSTADSAGNFSSPDQIQNGVMLPTTSVDQFAYTLGKWMGVSGSDLQTILPNLGQFDSSVYDLGFLNA